MSASSDNNRYAVTVSKRTAFIVINFIEAISFTRHASVVWRRSVFTKTWLLHYSIQTNSINPMDFRNIPFWHYQYLNEKPYYIWYELGSLRNERSFLLWNTTNWKNLLYSNEPPTKTTATAPAASTKKYTAKWMSALGYSGYDNYYLWMDP